jgi:Zn-dependent peptidase ImmA (M78 family)
MAKREATPTPALLIWARSSAGLSVEVAAKKIGVQPERLLSWEAGDQCPTFAQLRKLAEVYRRPLAVLYLAEAPRAFSVMYDFRRRLGDAELDRSPELTFEIRRARDRREWALELTADLDVQPKTIDAALSRDQNTELAAEEVRQILGVSIEQQHSWRADYEAFRRWRLLIEGAGVLTFQATGVEISEMRGFSIAERPFPVAVANIKDAPRGKIFSLLHEFVHVLLRNGGVCDLHEGDSDESSRTEAFCNRVAGAVLFPRSALLATEVVRRHKTGSPVWTDEELALLSRSFGGSREAALVRLLTLGLTTQRFYDEKQKEFAAIYAEHKKNQKGFAPPHEVALSSAGPAFTGLVIESLSRERISASDVADYLQVRLKHLPEIQRDYSKYAI